MYRKQGDGRMWFPKETEAGEIKKNYTTLHNILQLLEKSKEAGANKKGWEPNGKWGICPNPISSPIKQGITKNGDHVVKLHH